TRSLRDWSSDVCSSDLTRSSRRPDGRSADRGAEGDGTGGGQPGGPAAGGAILPAAVSVVADRTDLHLLRNFLPGPDGDPRRLLQIGRASCRERVWLSVR